MNSPVLSIDASGWMSGRPVPLDHGGPADVPFEPYPDEWLTRSALEILDDMVGRWPDRVIVDDGATQLTYTGLTRASHNLARHLHERLAPGTVVLALLRNVAHTAPILLGASAAHIILVPVDIGAPADRKLALLEASGAEAILFEEGSAPDLDFAPAEVARIALSIDTDTVAAAPSLPYHPDRVAAIAYTSGSTGQPKGIVYTLRHASAMVQRHINVYHINQNDVIAGVASLSAAGLREILCAVFSGAKLRPIDFMRMGMAESIRVMAEEGVTVLSFVTSALRMLLQVPGIDSAFGNLRALDLVGESTSAQDLSLFRTKLPADCAIGVGFGSTETNVIFRWFVNDALVTGAIVPSGYLDQGRCVRIEDEDGNPVPIGEAGELVVSDDVLALGYRSLTAEGGVDDYAFRARAGEPGPRTYHTGDVVRLRADGLLEFVGRRDRMVKIRGLQADLGEVEAALRSVASVDDAVTVPVTGSDGSVSLTAFVTSEGGDGAVPLADLRAAVTRQSAAHMVPSRFVFVSAIPRLHNGKPDLVRLQRDAAA